MRRFTEVSLPLALAASLLLTSANGFAQSQAATCEVRMASLRGSYEGDCVAGFASGKGRARGTDQYEGSWRDGWPTGDGIMTRANGNRSEGQFLEGRLNGRGKIVFREGTVIEGRFAAGVLVGVGQMTRADGLRVAIVDEDGKPKIIGRYNERGEMVPMTGSPVSQGQPSAPVPNGVTPPSPAPMQPSAQISTGQIDPATANMVKGELTFPYGDIYPAMIFAFANVPDDPKPVDVRLIDPTGKLKGMSGPSFGQVAVGIAVAQPNSRVRFQLRLDDELAEVAEEEHTLREAGLYLYQPRIRWRYERLRLVPQARPTNATLRVWIDGRFAGEVVKTARLRPINDAPFAMRRAGGTTMNFSVFAAFVTEDAPWIDRFLGDVLKNSRIGAFSGYQQGPRHALAQVEAIYNELKRRGVRYSSITTNTGTGAESAFISQTVRLPSEAMLNSQANCIDGVVLMASILRRIGLEPVMVFGPGHVMLGIVHEPGPNGRLAVVETTMIGTASFAQALDAGLRQYSEWLPQMGRNPAIANVNLREERARGVMPIPR